VIVGHFFKDFNARFGACVLRCILGMISVNRIFTVRCHVSAYFRGEGVREQRTNLGQLLT